MASTWRAKTVGPAVPSAYLDNRLPDDTSYGFHMFGVFVSPVASKIYVTSNV